MKLRHQSQLPKSFLRVATPSAKRTSPKAIVPLVRKAVARERPVALRDLVPNKSKLDDGEDADDGPEEREEDRKSVV